MPQSNVETSKVRQRKVDTTFKHSYSRREERFNLQASLLNRCWYPKPSVVFNVLLSARITSAFLSNISDCDETFNYWEPTHYLMYGNGFQTWEYSPEYAIRSYAYILLHVIPAEVIRNVFDANKLVVFYYVRFILGAICAACETYFYKGVIAQFGEHVARVMFVILIFNTGMFISATAYLPSSFAMCTCMLAFGGWFNQNFAVAIFGIAMGSLFGWPFCAILGVPIACDIVIRRKKIWLFIEWSVGSFAAIMIPLVAIDTHYYGKQVVAPLNIILYNIFGQGGPDLYGVEPWTFYFVNGLLNFNLIFPLALVSLPIYVVLDYFFTSKTKGAGYHIPGWLALSPMYIWFLVFFTRPHKEERFLFPVYPFICLAGSIALSSCQEIYHKIFTSANKRHYSSSSNRVLCIFLVGFSLISFSRSRALYVGYHAPLDVFSDLYNDAYQESEDHPPPFGLNEEVNICVGKEWYRFPSSFFLPSEKWNLQFIKSEFSGQLPKQYEKKPFATKVTPSHMNDENLEEPTRYVNISECDLLVDLAVNSTSKKEPNFSLLKNRWETVYSRNFLFASKSKAFFRAFNIPFLSEQYTTFVSYNILKSKKRRRKRKQFSFE